MEGSIKFGLWFVYIRWNSDNLVSRIRFVKTAVSGAVPVSLSKYLAGKVTTLYPLESIHLREEGTYGEIYRQVHAIPYGEIKTYKEIAEFVGTAPRVVGLAMKRNLTPILIPCHRVLSSHGLGGFTPDISIKEDLLKLESNFLKKVKIHEQDQV
ncbi:cysteine methyltransferase [Methanospirillum stamsii]|uniref:Cysteine methyltransferase n=2 Tax=Methanospirillum stamsii TaxID=1277351 RepID=A0A2V2N9E2_9EURY|nr:cysteine methyltransferase [Methanospirillum stamsii]